MDEDTPSAYVGRTGLSPSMWLNFTFNTWSESCQNSRKTCIQFTALHEFGHALGFFHEQDLPGNQPGTPGHCDNGIVQNDGVMLTQYDPNSNMNYCSEWGRLTLSELDLEGLRVAYGVSPFEFNSSGTNPRSVCTQLVEAADPHTWNDNYHCSAGYQGVSWSSTGPISGKRCAQSFEASDPHTWHDNYLCFSQRLVFSPWDRVAGYSCTQIREAADPHTWHDNWLCSQVDEGLQFSSTGPIAGKRCTLVNEPLDPYTWHDHYVCY